MLGLLMQPGEPTVSLNFQDKLASAHLSWIDLLRGLTSFLLLYSNLTNIILIFLATIVYQRAPALRIILHSIKLLN